MGLGGNRTLFAPVAGVKAGCEAACDTKTQRAPPALRGRGSRSCASCDQDGDDEEDEKASEWARLVAAEIEQGEPDQQRDSHSRSPSEQGLLQRHSPTSAQ